MCGRKTNWGFSSQPEAPLGFLWAVKYVIKCVTFSPLPPGCLTAPCAHQLQSTKAPQTTSALKSHMLSHFLPLGLLHLGSKILSEPFKTAGQGGCGSFLFIYLFFFFCNKSQKWKISFQILWKRIPSLPKMSQVKGEKSWPHPGTSFLGGFSLSWDSCGKADARIPGLRDPKCSTTSAKHFAQSK